MYGTSKNNWIATGKASHGRNSEVALMFRALVLLSFGFILIGCATESRKDQGLSAPIEAVFMDDADLIPADHAVTERDLVDAPLPGWKSALHEVNIDDLSARKMRRQFKK